jgi:hypothetical protein
LAVKIYPIHHRASKALGRKLEPKHEGNNSANFYTKLTHQLETLCSTLKSTITNLDAFALKQRPNDFYSSSKNINL